MNGDAAYSLLRELFPINRSLTGNGVRQTLGILRDLLPEMNIYEIPTGEIVNDWIVPSEWNLTRGYIEDQDGNVIIDSLHTNLHVMGYSTAIDRIITLSELLEHVYTLPKQPSAIPYVTSYYQSRWGFCMTEDQKSQLTKDFYHVVIDAELTDGSLTYADLLIPGLSQKEILFSTYVCHPAMANNELSGPVVAAALAGWISKAQNLKYSYRFVFCPETLGSIVYLSKNLNQLKECMVAGWVLTCLGDEGNFSYIPSRLGNTLADRLSLMCLSDLDKPFNVYSFNDRGSDERQYCWPGVDLPVASITRSKYHEYPQYHTSLDDLNFVSQKGLDESIEFFKELIRSIEKRTLWKAVTCGEPSLSRRGISLAPSTPGSATRRNQQMDVLVYCDGKTEIEEISRLCGLGLTVVDQCLSELEENGLIVEA